MPVGHVWTTGPETQQGFGVTNPRYYSVREGIPKNVNLENGSPFLTKGKENVFANMYVIRNPVRKIYMYKCRN